MTQSFIHEGLKMAYNDRMKYASDRRAWVRAADERLPQMIAESIKCQHDARMAYESWVNLGRPVSWMQFMYDINKESQMALFRVLMYDGMRRANMEPDSNV
jgi:hypothetical protein